MLAKINYNISDNKSYIGKTHLPNGSYKPYKYNCVLFTSKNTLLKSDSEITKKIKEVIKNSKNIIGFGGEGIVFRIPNSNYCIKINIPKPQCEWTDFLKHIRERIPDFNCEKWNFDITLKEKINHIVAKAEDKAVIMKYIKGNPLRLGQFPKNIYDLPDKTYINYIQQIEKARKCGLVFDYAPSNIIYNDKVESLKIIDFADPLKNSFWSYQQKHFSLLKDVFISLQTSPICHKNKVANKKWGGKLLNLIISELSKEGKSDFEITIEDCEKLLNQIMFSQEYEIDVASFEILKKQFKAMINLKSQNNKQNEIRTIAQKARKIVSEFAN